MTSTPRMGGSPHVRLFIKGDQGLSDALLARSDGGAHLQDGIQGRVDRKFPGQFHFEVFREPHFRADLALQQLEHRPIPGELHELGFPEELAAHSFRTALLDQPADLIVFSLAPEIQNRLWRHNRDGYLLHPPEDWGSRWSSAQRDWFQANFTDTGLQSVDAYFDSFSRILQILKEKTAAHLIAFGCSTVDPADTTYAYRDAPVEATALRAERYNLAMFQLSQSEGLTVIDVDRVIAELGAGRHLSRPFEYSPEACAALCDEFLYVLEDVGFFSQRPLLMQVGAR